MGRHFSKGSKSKIRFYNWGVWRKSICHNRRTRCSRSHTKMSKACHLNSCKTTKMTTTVMLKTSTTTQRAATAVKTTIFPTKTTPKQWAQVSISRSTTPMTCTIWETPTKWWPYLNNLNLKNSKKMICMTLSWRKRLRRFSHRCL